MEEYFKRVDPKMVLKEDVKFSKIAVQAVQAVQHYHDFPRSL